MPSLPIACEDVGNWKAAGDERAFGFCATTEEVQAWLLRDLPAEYAPYELVRSGWTSVGGRDVAIRTRRTVGELRACVGDAPERGWSSLHIELYIGSTKLTPAPAFTRDRDADEFCRLNGMLRLIAFGDASWRLSLFDAAEHVETGEVRRHEEYLAIFRRLQTVITAALTYTLWYRETIEWVEADYPAATEGATRIFERFDGCHLPGRRVK